MKKVLIVLLFTLFLVGCSNTSTIQNSPTEADKTFFSTEQSQDNNRNMTNSSPNSNNPDDAEKKIEVKAIPTEGGDLCVFLTNHNDYVIDELDVEVVFFDASGNMIATDSDGHDMLLPNATVVSRLVLPDKYDKFETNVTVELDVNPYYSNHSENIEITQNITDTGAIARVKNNDSTTIDEIEIIAVFYNGDQIVSVSYPIDIYNLRPGKTDTVDFSCYSSKTFEGLKFDKAEIYLNQAHTFGF